MLAYCKVESKSVSLGSPYPNWTAIWARMFKNFGVSPGSMPDKSMLTFNLTSFNFMPHFKTYSSLISVCNLIVSGLSPSQMIAANNYRRGIF
jgi:hypothetical protein